MDTLFDIRGTHNPHRWFMPITPEICVPFGESLFMFGGVGLASSITALERTTGRPVVWATAQYLSFAHPPSVLDLDVRVVAEGRYNSQARVVGHVGDKEILTVNAALGERPDTLSAQWLQAPTAPPPEDCEPSSGWNATRSNLPGRVDVRLAQDRAEGRGSGGVRFWCRPRERFPIDAGMLAVFADLVPPGLTHAIGQRAQGNSLDNTLRVRRIVPTEWVLCDIHIHGVHGGFGHGAMHLFAQSGELMATASQSFIMRMPPPKPD